MSTENYSVPKGVVFYFTLNNKNNVIRNTSEIFFEYIFFTG